MTTTYTNKKFSIKAWAEEDRPREKLLAKGKSALSDAELIAILIGSGSREESAVSLSQRVLQRVNNNLDALGKQSIKDLMEFKGIGEAKAISIVAALELGRRRQLTDIKQKPKIASSKDAYQVLAPLLMDLSHEEFWVLYVNRANRVIARERISVGGIDRTIVDVKIIFQKALQHLASGIILCHNHPSGNLSPSTQDLNITRKIKNAGLLLEITTLDHIIISQNDYYSFADEGLM